MLPVAGAVVDGSSGTRGGIPGEMEADHAKQYSEACIQTSPVASATRTHDPNTVNTTPIPSRLKRVTYMDQTSSGTCYDDSRSRRVYPRTPISRAKTQLPLSLPTQVLSPSVTLEEPRRVVSLPEQAGPELLSQKLANSLAACSRNVSMPAVVQHFPQTELACEELPSMHVSPSVSYEENSGPRNYSQTSDFPCTPSFDSSSSSIEIIDGSLHFSETFLQAHKNQAKTMHKDWLDWHSSPPRPIPALHGPSSLPYARCPSGAEGTIIEEQSNVPGLIWGLKGSNVAVEKSMADHGLRGIPPISSAIQEQRISYSNDTQCIQGQSSTKTTQEPGQSRAVQCISHPESSEQDCVALHKSPYPEHHKPSMPSNIESKHHGLRPPDGEIKSPQRNDQAVTDATGRNAGNHCQQSVVALPRAEIRRTPGSLSHTDLQDRAQDGRSVYLDDPARNQTFTHDAFARSDMMAGSAKVQCMETKTSQRPEVGERHTDACSLRRRCTCFQDMPLTPPDSTSTIWSSQFSPLTVDQVVTRQWHAPDGSVQPHASQLCGLNLRTTAESSESLSDQLKKLILRDQIKPEHRCDHTPYLNQERVSAPPTRPEMPINLYDLVTRHVHAQSTSEAGISGYTSAPHEPPLKPDPTTTSQTSQPIANIEQADFPSKIRQGRREARGDIIPGMRHPKSIPLTRLLERKLASVPEETSFISTGSDVLAPKTCASLPPISTSGQARKDYDFVELRSPLEETAAEEVPTLQRETPHRINERRVLQPAKQRKGQSKQKTRADAKSAPAKTKELKTERNNENVHVIEPTPPTTGKKSKASNTFSFKRGSQKPRRAN